MESPKDISVLQLKLVYPSRHMKHTMAKTKALTVYKRWLGASAASNLSQKGIT